MDLYILRHGEAGKRSSISKDDSKRSLTLEGQREMVEISKGLKTLGIEFDYIFTSPLLRARQTADIVIKNVKSKNQIKELDELKPEGNKLNLYNKLSVLRPDSSVLIIGHEPYLSELVGEAISQGNCRINLKKAGLARIRARSLLPTINGELKWLLAPKHLKKMK